MLNDLSFTIYGDRKPVTRADIARSIEALGGSTRSDVSWGRDFLVLATAPGKRCRPNRILTAIDRGVPILDWTTFESLRAGKIDVQAAREIGRCLAGELARRYQVPLGDPRRKHPGHNEPCALCRCLRMACMTLWRCFRARRRAAGE